MRLEALSRPCRAFFWAGLRAILGFLSGFGGFKAKSKDLRRVLLIPVGRISLATAGRGVR